MRELEGRSYQEIAEILGVSVSAVETLIFRARRALREQLEEGITCHEAELAISRQLDGRLARKDKGALRAHLRECDECARFARSQRAQRGALKSLGAIPLPQSLASLFGGGGSAVGTGLAVKAAAVGAGAIVATGAGYEGVKHGIWQPRSNRAAAVAQHHGAHQRTAATPTAAVLSAPPFRTLTDDLKPFRPRPAAAYAPGKGSPKNSAREAAPGRQKHLEVSALPPSRAGRPLEKPKLAKTHPTRNNDHAKHPPRGQTRRYAPPPPPPPPPPKRHTPPPHHERPVHATLPHASGGKSNR
jgi:hypothetical protein